MHQEYQTKYFASSNVTMKMFRPDSSLSLPCTFPIWVRAFSEGGFSWKMLSTTRSQQPQNVKVYISLAHGLEQKKKNNLDRDRR